MMMIHDTDLSVCRELVREKLDDLIEKQRTGDFTSSRGYDFLDRIEELTMLLGRLTDQ